MCNHSGRSRCKICQEIDKAGDVARADEILTPLVKKRIKFMIQKALKVYNAHR